MKKSLIALATLSAFAGAVSAQSSVTIGGKLDLAIGKSIGSADKGFLDSAGSRLYFQIIEDLGGGLKAIGFFENRFNPDDGTNNPNVQNGVAAGTQDGRDAIFNGSSWVGFQGGFGRVIMGRMYTSAFTGFGSVQNNIDPFGGDGVAALRGVGMIPGVAKVRNANAIRYDFSANGFNFSADIGERGKNNTGATDASVTKKPMSFSMNYGAGPLFVGFSHENPGGSVDKLNNFGARYAIGGVTLRAGLADGTAQTGAKVKGYLLGGNMAIGAGDLRFGVAQSKLAGVSTAKKIGLGYHYDLSKRTKVYADVARDSVPATDKVGYALGMQHNF